jgi:hypothetical protein
MQDTSTHGDEGAFKAFVAAPEWQLDPLGNITGSQLTIDRVSIVRIVCVAAETGARMQRDGLTVDPVAWMVTPLDVFEGRPAIEACMERDGCSMAVLIHGLGLGLDVDRRTLDQLINQNDFVAAEVGCD